MAWKCVLLEPTERCRRWLRVYESDACTGGTYCDGEIALPDGAMVWTLDAEGRRSHWRPDESDVPADAAYPTHCEQCGRAFTAAANRHVRADQLFRHPDGTEHTIRDMPIGAIWRVEWHESHWAGPDGRCYSVQLPPGGIGDQWVIEQPSANGGGWTRTGEPPDLTATPSILTPRYHGWLRDGWLTDDTDGRTYGGEGR